MRTLTLALVLSSLLACNSEDDTQATVSPQSSAQSSAATQSTTAQSEEPAASDPLTTETDLEPEPIAAEPNEPEAAVTPPPLPEGYAPVAQLSETPVRAFNQAPAYALEDGQDYFAVVDTSKGRMLLDLFQDQTPTSVNNFVFLARHGYYDGIAFHRVIDGFVVQGGDPNTLEPVRDMWGMGGPGYSIPLEVRQGLNFNEAGILGMARAQDPNSGGSQFYITLAPASNLNGQYTVFGRVIEGLDVLQSITRFEAQDPATGATNTEGTPDTMTQVRIVTRPKQ